MVEEGFFDVYWTPGFTEDIHSAVSYIANELRNPLAAKRFFQGVVDLLESKRSMPTAALSYIAPNGSKRFVAKYKRWQVFYVIEEGAIKVIGLKHELQGSPRGVLPNETYL